MKSTEENTAEHYAMENVLSLFKMMVSNCNERMRVLDDRATLQAIEATLDYSRLQNVS